MATMGITILIEEFFGFGIGRHPIARKLILGTIITAGVLGLLGGLFIWFYVLPKIDKEIAELKNQIKNLENSIR